MPLIQPHIVRVAVGPPGQVGRQWSDLYIKFEIKRTTGRTPNKAKIEIYNLSPESLLYLDLSAGQTVQLLAGVGTPSTIFYGDLKRRGVKTKMQHPNQVTTLEALDGRRVLQGGTFTRSYPAGTTRTQIRTDALAANAIPTGYIAPIPERVYQAPVSYAAPLAEVLDDLYWGEFCNWSLQDGAFQLLALGQAMPGNAPIVSEKTGLFGEVERTDKGVKFNWSQMGLLKPGSPFSLQSRLSNGSFRATKIVDKGDTEILWQSTVTGVPIGL